MRWNFKGISPLRKWESPKERTNCPGEYRQLSAPINSRNDDFATDEKSAGYGYRGPRFDGNCLNFYLRDDF